MTERAQNAEPRIFGDSSLLLEIQAFGGRRKPQILAGNRGFLHKTARIRGEQRAPENATHPKTQVTGGSRNLRFRVCCVFGCSLFPSKRAPNTPENATHPKSQIPGTTRYSRFRVCCTFGCVLAPAKGNRRLGSVTLGPSPLARPYIGMGDSWGRYLSIDVRGERLTP